MRSSIVKVIIHNFRHLKSVFVLWAHGGHITSPGLKMKLTGSDRQRSSFDCWSSVEGGRVKRY